MDFKKIADFKSIREMALAVFYYASGSIFGPLLVFGVLGYLLDKFFVTSPTFLIVGVFVAFVTTNILLYRKVARINKLIEAHGQKNKVDNYQKQEIVEEINKNKD